MKFVILIENSGKAPLHYEHGLSILIEYEREHFLLDAGTTDLFLENAKMLEVPLGTVKNCFLSHGHYDHSGGFGTYLDENKNAVVYMMKGATREFYSGAEDIHPIGIPREVVEKHEERFRYVETFREFQKGIYLVPHSTLGLEVIGKRAELYRKEGDALVPDDFFHEMSLVFDTPKGLVIFNSCSHGGSMNIIREVRCVFPGKNVYAFIGGLHMKGGIFSEEELKKLSDELKQTGLQVLYTGHCTGYPAMETLKKYMGEIIKEIYTGLTVEL